MHSSCNLIKRDRVLNKDATVVKTEFVIHSHKENEHKEKNTGVSYEEAQNFIQNYEKIGQNIIIEAQKKKDSFMFETIASAEKIEREAYEKGYAQGTQNGYEDGKKEAYDKFVPEATKDADEIRERADNILKSAKESYESYLNSQKQNILELSLVIAENILKREIKDGINNFVDEAMKLCKGQENVIIKCNPKHEEELKKELFIWKTSYSISGDIFILPDDKIACGNAIIEKSTGKIEVGLDIGMERIREVVMG